MMDIDTTETKTTSTSTQVKIHPLAIIGISDHQTRITTGGGKSSFSFTTPIIGLLFGYQNGITVTIIDAEEVEYPSSSSNPHLSDKEKHENIKTKIELHQKVFPTHEVVGWYRVDLNKYSMISNKDRNGDEEDDMVLPTENDLLINNGWMKEYNESPIFVLMDGNEKNEQDNDQSMDRAGNPGKNIDNHQPQQGEGEKDPKKKKNVEDARDKLDRDEQLPIAIYETMIVGGSVGAAVTTDTAASTGAGGMVFVNLEFELETFEPERIAVEKVFQTQPKNSGGGVVTTTTMPKNDEPSATETKKISSDDNNAVTSSTMIQQTQSEIQLQSLISSIEAMNTRIAVLLNFLQKTQSGEIPPNHALLRQVQSLIHQLPLVMGRGIYDPSRINPPTTSTTQSNVCKNEEKVQNDVLALEFESEYDDMMIVSFLATIAKTTKAVLSYSEKFKIVSESKGKDHGKSRFDRFKDDL